MNNILDFETFRLNEWNKIIINKDNEGNISISGDDIDNETQINLLDVVSEDKGIRLNVSGGYEGGEFMKQIKENLKLIKSIKLTTTKEFPEESNDNYIKFDNDIISKDDVNKIFTITPKNSKSIGKGEVLLATYYKNVDRILIPAKGGESGDNCYYDKNGKKYIEVKTGGAAFRKLSTYKLMDGYQNIKDDIEKLIGKFEKDDIFEYIGGLTCYFYKMRKQKNTDLIFVLFDNKYNGSGTASKHTDGYLQIPILDDIIKTYENIKTIGQCFISEKPESKGGKLSRDFTISLNDKKIEIFKNK